jgi:hypothetical protein
MIGTGALLAARTSAEGAVATSTKTNR